MKSTTKDGGNVTTTTTGRIEDMGNGVYFLANPSVIVATDSKTGAEVARFTNWDDADIFIAEAMRTGGEFDINEVPTA